MMATTPQAQVFFWCGQGERRGLRTYYQNFCLNNQQYSIGDCGALRGGGGRESWGLCGELGRWRSWPGTVRRARGR